MKLAREYYIKQMALRLAMEDIKRYQQKIGQIILYYQTSGQFKFLIDGHMYKGKKYYRMDFVNKFINKNYNEIRKIRNVKGLQTLLEQNDIEYRRLF